MHETPKNFSLTDFVRMEFCQILTSTILNFSHAIKLTGANLKMSDARFRQNSAVSLISELNLI